MILHLHRYSKYSVRSGRSHIHRMLSNSSVFESKFEQPQNFLRRLTLKNKQILHHKLFFFSPSNSQFKSIHIEQIKNLFIIDLKERAVDCKHSITIISLLLLNSLKQISNSLLCHTHLTVISFHRVCLTTTCLTVGEYRGMVTFESSFYH